LRLIRRFLGPRSKYLNDLPFTYEASVCAVEDPPIAYTLVSDTICRLVDHLDREGVAPDRVEIREVYPDRETLIRRSLYTSAEGEWLMRPAICRSLEVHYPGHTRGESCTFSDRDVEVL
jgi:hypothetical protein